MEDNWRPLEGAGRVTRVREGSDGMVDGESLPRLPDLDDAGHKRGGGMRPRARRWCGLFLRRAGEVTSQRSVHVRKEARVASPV